MFKQLSARRRKKGAPAAKEGRQGRVTVSVHPLFFALGAYFLLTGRFFVFLSVTAAALLHESGHAFYAARIGCRLNRLRLLPCGAVAEGSIDGISLADEVRLALAGPAVNAVCAAAFVALWWLFPETYPYTDVACYASAALAAVNLLPAYPLDGGRVLWCLAAKKKGEKFARVLSSAVGKVFGAVFLGLFAASLFFTPNPSLLFFALFLLLGGLGTKDCRYERIRFDLSRELARGAPVRKIALSENVPVKRALAFLERGTLAEFDLFSAEGEYVCTLTQREFCDALAFVSIYAPISACLTAEDPENTEIPE